jgi:hypothetical protein
MRLVLLRVAAVDGWASERVVDMPMYDDSGKVKDTYEVHVPGGVYWVDLDTGKHGTRQRYGCITETPWRYWNGCPLSRFIVP